MRFSDAADGLRQKAILTPAASVITKTPIESAARSRYDKKPADQFLAAVMLQSQHG